MMMTDYQFSEFVAMSRRNLENIQADFSARIANGERWHYDLIVCTLYFDGVAMPMTPIGTYSNKYQSFLWAWANEDFPPLAREKSKQLQGLHATTGFQIFMSAALSASPDECSNLIAVAVHHLDGAGFFRVPSKDLETPTLYFSIDKRNS